MSWLIGVMRVCVFLSAFPVAKAISELPYCFKVPMPTHAPSLIVLQPTHSDGCRVMGNELVLQGLVPVKVLSRVSLH